MAISWHGFVPIYLLQILIPSVYGCASYDGSIKFTDAYTTCSKGWFEFGDMCYKAGGKTSYPRQTWRSARQACDAENGHLATVYSQEIQDFLSAFLLVPAESSLWIGLHDKDNENDYKWEDGTPYNFTYYEPGEPSGFDRDEEDCMEMVYKTIKQHGEMGQWNDNKCGRSFPYLCQKAKSTQDSETAPSEPVLDPRYCMTEKGIGWRFEKSCFYVVPEKKNWVEAEDHCVKEFKGHLATLDYRVNYFLHYVLRDVTEDLWIGVKIKEEAQQKWSSGWLVSFDNWAEQKKYVDGTCMVLNKNGAWLIQYCGMELWFLCEYSTSKATPPVLKPSVENTHCPKLPQGSQGWRDFGGDFCYFLDLEASVSWREANYNCKTRGGTLASLHSQEEMNVLLLFLRYYPFHFFHIGLYRLDSYGSEFAWVDGSKVNFTRWYPGEPTKYEDSRICSMISMHNKAWFAELCIMNRGYICSTPKVAPNSTTIDIPPAEGCKNTVSIIYLWGTIACLLVVSTFLGVALCYLIYRDRGYDRVKELSSMKMLTPSNQEKIRRYRPETVV